MPPAIHVQHHPGQRPAWTPLAVRSPLPVSLDQSGILQCRLDPGVAQRDLFLAVELLHEVLYIQIEIFLPIEPQDFLHDRDVNSFRTRQSRPSIQKVPVASRAQSLSPTPHAPIRDSDDLGRLKPCDLSAHRSCDHFLDLHCPLHGSGRV